MIMKNAIISFVFATAIMIGSACSTAKDVRVTERRDSDGTVVKKERKIDNDGDVVVKKKKHRRGVDDKDVKVKVDRDRRNDVNDDQPAIIIKKDR
jgi:hypothetical protein